MPNVYYLSSILFYGLHSAINLTLYIFTAIILLLNSHKRLLKGSSLMGNEKIDRRVVLQSNSLEELTKIANSLELDKSINERERMGAAIESLLDIKLLFDIEFIKLGQTSKERIHTMIGFGEYSSKEEVVSLAIEKLFAEHREKIIKKIEAL